MDNVELRPLPTGAHRSFTHDGQDPWATDDVSDSYRFADDGSDENLVQHKPTGDPKSAATPMTSNDAPGHARGGSKQLFLHTDGESLLEEKEEKGRWWARLRGWRFGAANCVTAVAVVFLINLSLTLYVATAKGWQDGRGILYEGLIPSSGLCQTLDPRSADDAAARGLRRGAPEERRTPSRDQRTQHDPP